MPTCIVAGLPTHLVQELNVGTVRTKLNVNMLVSMTPLCSYFVVCMCIFL